ncbi:MAG: O-antigen ligase family protein [Thermodesulfobacteriota bacterium]
MRDGTAPPSPISLPIIAAGLFCLLGSSALLATPWYPLAIAPVALVFVFFQLLRRPAAGLYLIVFLMPFGAYRTLGGPLSFIKVHWVIAALMLAIVLLELPLRRGNAARLGFRLWPWLAIFLGVNLLAFYLSPFPATGADTVLRLLLGYLFIALVLYFLTDAGFRQRLPQVIVLSVGLSALLALIGFLFKVEFFAADAVEGDFTRGTGGTTWASSLSQMIIFAFPLLLHRLLHPAGPRQRLFQLIGLFVLLGGMVTTFSRGGAMILTLITLLSLWQYRSRLRARHLGLLLSTAALFVAVLLALTPATYWERQRSLASGEDQSIGRRQSYLRVGLDAFLQQPLIGHGPGAFRDIYADSAYARMYQKEDQTLRRFAHNTYLEVLVGSGVSGLALFLLLLLLAWRNFQKAKRLFDEAGNRCMATLAGSYQLSFLSVCLYFFLASGLDNKYFLLSLPLSQVALNLARTEKAGVAPA